MAVDVISFGCRLNLAEGEGVKTAAMAAGLANAVIINSCAVTAEAERQARQAIRRAARAHPGRPILVTGCAADTNRAAFADMAEVAAIIPNAAKRAEAPYAQALSPASVSVPPFAAPNEWTPVVSGSDHARAFIEVQNGCDHRCTYCIIPYGRGPSRSAAAMPIIDRIRAVVAAGQQEVILTGVDLTSYGHDLPGQPTLGRLVQRILDGLPDLPRLRLSSLDPVEIDPLLFALITSEPRVMPHLHLSLQAGDDMILKRMKRRHSRQQAVDLCQALHAARPGIAIGADLIAGFPTETESMSDNSLRLIADAGLSMAHVFPFSAREGTPAARMPQLDRAVVLARAKALRAEAEAAHSKFLKALVGATRDVLIENDGLSGHTPEFARVTLGLPITPRRIVPVRITAVTGKTLRGDVIDAKGRALADTGHDA